MVVSKLRNKEKIVWYQVLLIGAGLFGYQLFSFLPADLQITDSRLFTIPYRAFFLGLSLFVLVKRRSYKIDSRNSLLILILIFWGLYLLRLSYDTIFNATDIVKPLSDYWLFSVGLCFIPMMAFKTPISEKTLIRALYFSFFLCLFVNLLGLTFNSSSITDVTEERQAGNDFLNPISYGQTGASLGILSLVLFMRNRKKSTLSIFYLLGIPLGVLTLALSLSRGPIVDFVILIILFFYKSLKKVQFKIASLLVITGLIFFLASSGSIPFVDNIFKLLQSTLSAGNESDEERFKLFFGGINQFINNPIFGDLIEERTVHSYPHNLIVESLMACGIVGGILMFAIQLKSIIQSSKLLKNSNTLWIGLLFIMQLISSTFAGGLYADYVFWYLLAMVNVLYFQQRFVRKQLTLQISPQIKPA